MNTTVLLQRQMELHGTLRRPPHTPAQLKEIHESMKELAVFFDTVRSLAKKLESLPETVFQCLMHIGLGDTVSFDMQRRDGLVPMHQAKVLTRTKAIELEPCLREMVSATKLGTMVDLSKKTRTLLRIKVEDGNDFDAAESALQSSIEYLDFIEAASGNAVEIMFKFYMVEDEASLLRLLGRGAPCEASDGSEEALLSTTEALPPLPDNTHLDSEIHRLASLSLLTTMAAGDRLKALRTIEKWLETLSDECFLSHIRQCVSRIIDPLSTCAMEKRSAICRQACNVIGIIAARTPATLYHDGPLRVALGKWCTSLLSGVFVTVSTIAQATDAAIRALVVGSRGHPAALKSILDALEAGTHHEMRRKSLGYIALGIVASHGEPYHTTKNASSATIITAVDLSRVAKKYMETGDAACRKMARTLCIALSHFMNLLIPVSDKKTESLIRQETLELKPLLEKTEAFEKTIFGAGVVRRHFSAPGMTEKITRLSGTQSRQTAGVTHSKSTAPDTNLYDTHDDLRTSNV